MTTTPDRDAWRPIAAWLADRCILAPVRGADAFREHVVDVMAMNAAWRLATGLGSLDGVLRAQAETDWLSCLPTASCDDLAIEAWVAMRDRLAGALIDLECLSPSERPR